MKLFNRSICNSEHKKSCLKSLIFKIIFSLLIFILFISLMDKANAVTSVGVENNDVKVGTESSTKTHFRMVNTKRVSDVLL